MHNTILKEVLPVTVMFFSCGEHIRIHEKDEAFSNMCDFPEKKTNQQSVHVF